MLQIDRRVLSHFDFLIPLIILPIIITSHILIGEINPTLAHKQTIYFIIGIGAFLLFFILPIRKFIWIVPFFYWFNILLLALVDIIGVTKLGATRWLEIPFVHFTIQPSEIFKPFFILMLAYLIKNDPPPKEGYDIKKFLKFSFYILLPFFLIAKEPDLGTAMILLFVGYGTLFIVGVNRKIWISIFIIIVISAPILYNSLHDYQKKRIEAFIHNKPSYHVKQSLITIGSGGLIGKKKEEATQARFKFLPIATSDFIFSYFVERFGFWGALTLISAYALLIIHLLITNYKLKGDYLASVSVSALALMIFFYMSINIAMTIGLSPVVGVPLPFFSYGGSSFITFMMLFGIVENMLAFRFDSLYESIHYRFGK
ncbi:MAG: rod shape-determining protein RodA [Epsilonproteobacteria bacterium]|nr:rod shape-determining protein RodA [Campylobacterota bacterium]